MPEGPPGPLALRVVPDPRAVRTARRFAVASVDALGGDADAQDTVRSVVSELVTNVLLHARTEALVAVSQDGEHIRVAVIDGSPALPQQRRVTGQSTTGRGLRLLRTLTVDSGVAPDASVSVDGKAVWFRVRKATSAGSRQALAAAAFEFFDVDLELR